MEDDNDKSWVLVKSQSFEPWNPKKSVITLGQQFQWTTLFINSLQNSSISFSSDSRYRVNQRITMNYPLISTFTKPPAPKCCCHLSLSLLLSALSLILAGSTTCFLLSPRQDHPERSVVPSRAHVNTSLVPGSKTRIHIYTPTHT